MNALEIIWWIVGAILIISTVSIFVSEAQYDLGFDCEAYKAGERAGYSSHNESIYNESLEYAYSHLPRVGGDVRGPKDVFYYAHGYVDGYKKWRDENEVSEMCELLETEYKKNEV